MGVGVGVRTDVCALTGMGSADVCALMGVGVRTDVCVLTGLGVMTGVFNEITFVTTGVKCD